MFNMQYAIVRTHYRASNVSAFDVSPRLGIAIHTAVTPANHHMSSKETAIAQLIRSDQVAKIFRRLINWHNQTYMDPVRFYKYVDTFSRGNPAVVRRNMTADKRASHVETDYQKGPRNKRPHYGPHAVDAKQFQV